MTPAPVARAVSPRRSFAPAVVLGGLVIGAYLLLHRRAQAPSAASGGATAYPGLAYDPTSSGLLIPSSTYDSSAYDIENAVQPQLDSIASRIWQLQSGQNGMVSANPAPPVATNPPPGYAYTAPPPPSVSVQ